MKSIYGLTSEKLEKFIIDIGEKKYRAGQIMDWLYVKRVESFTKMSNLPLTLIHKLEEKLRAN